MRSTQGRGACFVVRRAWLAASALLVLALTGAAVLLGATSASAHARLVEMTPAPDSRLAAAPTEVLLRFDEPVSLTGIGVRVFDAAGQEVTQGEAEHPDGAANQARVRLRAGLPDGGYLVSWRVVSADTHPIHGAYVFTIGTGPALAVADTGDDPWVGGAVDVAKGVQYAGLVLLLGIPIFLLFCWRPGLRDRGSWRWVGAGAGLVAAGAVLALALEGPLEDDTGLAAAADLARLWEAVGTGYGQTLLLRVLLAGLTWALAVWATRATRSERTDVPGPWRWAPAGIAAAALVATYAASGHAAVGSLSWLAQLSVALHLLAVCTWLGGLTVLATRLTRTAHRSELPAAATAFSIVALVAVAAINATGVLQAWREVGSWAALFATGYGRLVVAKVALLVVVLGLAVASRRWVQTSRRSGTGPGWPLRRSVSAELGVAVVVLALSAVLTGTPPAKDTHDVALHQHLALPSAGQVTVAMTPARTGTNTVELTVTDPAGHPHDYPEVVASLSLAARDIGPLPILLDRTDVGTYRAAATIVPVPGDWQLTVTVRTTDVDITAASTPVALR